MPKAEKLPWGMTLNGAACAEIMGRLTLTPRSDIDMRRMPQPFDSSDIPVVTHHQQGDYMTTDCHTNQIITHCIQCQCRFLGLQSFCVGCLG